VIVVAAGGEPTAVIGEDERDDDEIVCYGNLPVLGSHCFEHPADGLPTQRSMPDH
jgi:hypothetical protein